LHQAPRDAAFTNRLAGYLGEAFQHHLPNGTARIVRHALMLPCNPSQWTADSIQEYTMRLLELFYAMRHGLAAPTENDPYSTVGNCVVDRGGMCICEGESYEKSVVTLPPRKQTITYVEPSGSYRRPRAMGWAPMKDKN
jgi:hypothetical protein